MSIPHLPLPAVECPTCSGAGTFYVGSGSRTHRITCQLCVGTGELERSVAEAFRVGVEMGRSSAYLGHYDQYDTGSLMFSNVESPYTDDTVPGEVNYRTGF